jgi:hypothetical protein
MNRRFLGGALLGIGIILILAGLILMLVIVPGMKEFPDDVDTTRLYAGTMPVLLNPETFEFMTDLDVELERHFKTEETDGDVALVLEEQTLLSNGQPLQRLVKHYAINRKTMEWAKSYPDDWKNKEGFWDRAGLVMGWPIDTEKKDYVGWSDDYRDTVELVFAGEEERGGIDTYLFTAERPAQPINPEQVDAMGLPTELPTDQFVALVQGGDVPDSVKNMIPLLTSLWKEDTIPLQYYYEYEGKYWVEPQTGVLIDTWKHELRKVGLGEAVVEAVPVLANMDDEQRAASRVAVFDLTYQGIDQTLKDAKKDAEDAIDQINLFGTIIPIIAIVAGVVLGLLGIVLLLQKSKPASAA